MVKMKCLFENYLRSSVNSPLPQLFLICWASIVLRHKNSVCYLTSISFGYMMYYIRGQHHLIFRRIFLFETKNLYYISKCRKDFGSCTSKSLLVPTALFLHLIICIFCDMCSKHASSHIPESAL